MYKYRFFYLSSADPIRDPSNPWNRKKGSDLFPSKPTGRLVVGGEDDDADLKRALQVSLETAEAEDRARRVDLYQYEKPHMDR